MHLNTVSLST